MADDREQLLDEIGDLRRRLAHAEAMVDALRGGEVDAVVGRHQVVLLRLREAEEELQQLNKELERRVEERTAEAEERARQLRTMTLELTHAEERERQRLATYLHDHLQQHLVGMRFHVSTLDLSTTDPQLTGDIATLSELVDEAVRAARSLAHDLSPEILHRDTLPASMGRLPGWAAERLGLEMEAEVSPAADPADPRLKVFLFQAARELLVNVARHAGGSAARLSMQHDGDRLILEVSDHGRGFDAQGLVHLLDSQNGLGLRSIRERAEALGGGLEIESADGDGASVRVAIPWSPPSQAAEEARPGEGKEQGAPLRVLLVDDHRVMRHGLSTLLTGHPDLVVVGEAGDGRQGLELARQLEPDVVLMDVAMPEMDGVEATRRIRELLPQVRVIGLSMHEDEHVARRMLQAGAESFLSKAGSTDHLLATIRGGSQHSGRGARTPSLGDPQSDRR